MKTLKEQQVTSLSELLQNVKEEKEEVAKQETKNKESAIDRAAKRLNVMFEKYWTPLFDKDKEYPLWNDNLLIYFGQGMGDYFRLEETPINKIVLTNSHDNTRTTYPESVSKSYNKILNMIVIHHMYKDFSKELDFHKVLNNRSIRHNIESFSDLIYQIQRLTYDSIEYHNDNDNTLKIQDQKIKVFPTLNFAKNYYHKLKSINVNDYRAYTNENAEVSEILHKRLMTHQDNLTNFKETISQLVKSYSNICNKLLPESDVQEIKKEFISYCNKYGLDSNDYVVSVSNWHNFKLTFYVTERFPWEHRSVEEYLKDNSHYETLKSKEKGSTFDYADLESGVKNLAIDKFTRNLADKVYQNTQSKLKELKNVEFIQKQQVKFGTEEIQINKKYSGLQIYHNECKFYSLFNDSYNFSIISNDKNILEQPFDELKKRLETSAEVIEKFLKS